MKIWAALLMWLIAGAAIAAPRVSLIALNPEGTRAVLTYNQDWVEVGLDVQGAQRLVAPSGCRWTSMAYAPVGDGLAMSAYCAPPGDECRDAQSLLLASGTDRNHYRLLADISGARWSDIYWREGGDEVLALERALSPRIVTNLSDLGKTAGGCEIGPSQMISLRANDGRRIRIDLLPQDWRIKKIVAASTDMMIAEVAMRRGGPSNISAAAQLDAICAQNAKHNLCRSAGVTVKLIWQEGDWWFATTPDQARLGRMVASADLSVIGRERCEARWVDDRFRPICALQFERTGSAAAQLVEITAPEGLFGDLALSPDGRWMLAVASGIGRRLRQFDLFDTTTGARTSFPDLLTLSPPFIGLPLPDPEAQR